MAISPEPTIASVNTVWRCGAPGPPRVINTESPTSRGVDQPPFQHAGSSCPCERFNPSRRLPDLFLAGARGLGLSDLEYKQVGPMKIARSHTEQTVSKVA